MNILRISNFNLSPQGDGNCVYTHSSGTVMLISTYPRKGTETWIYQIQ